MTTAVQLASYLDDLLAIQDIPDYPNALNGLQLTNQAPIKKVASAVDFSSQTINATIETQANFLIVHHGMFWSGLSPITGPHYTRIKALIDNDIAVYSAHLPLDCHPIYGNNALLAHELGLTPSAPFAAFKTIAIGVRGTSDIASTELAAKARTFAAQHNTTLRTTPIGPEQRTTHWAICTGSGASSDTLREAAQLGVDTLIVGEGPHHTAIDSAELGITVMYAGHYATETFGVRALAQQIERQFNIPWTFVEAPTGL